MIVWQSNLGDTVQTPLPYTIAATSGKRRSRSRSRSRRRSRRSKLGDLVPTPLPSTIEARTREIFENGKRRRLNDEPLVEAEWRYENNNNFNGLDLIKDLYEDEIDDLVEAMKTLTLS
ncbi:hypothetical protein N9O88_00875 [bacterium]|nr:hypothetical protein [bacterium]